MYDVFLKRLFDVVASLCALVILSPVMLLIALAIRLDDKGPALLVQERVGQSGNLFRLFKFRSMPVNTAYVPSTKADNLPITRVGRFIRRTNLDELPQLLNILKGDMSMVGPRPALPSQTELIAMRRKNGALFRKPGLTGAAQVNSYDGMPEEEKADWDGRYARRVSFLADLGLIRRTVHYLLRRPPVY